MNAPNHQYRPVRDKLVNAGALGVLLLVAALALFGPSGILAWGEDSARLVQHRVQIAALQDREAELENRRELLDPANVDPDLASELVRRDLNVAHPDEYVIELDGQPQR
jgi:cell division protein FtsB